MVLAETCYLKNKSPHAISSMRLIHPIHAMNGILLRPFRANSYFVAGRRFVFFFIRATSLDAGTAEICRAQVWQWVNHGAKLHDRRTVTVEMVRVTLSNVLYQLRARIGDERFRSGRFTTAARILENIMTSESFPEFLTQVAYNYLK